MGPRNRSGYTAYEALQPPLYYRLMAVVMRVMGAHSLATQVRCCDGSVF